MSRKTDIGPVVRLAALDGQSLVGPVNRIRLRPPRLANALIGRERRLALLDDSLSTDVTVIQAPAGFGKTVISALWYAKAMDLGATCFWLTVEPHEDYDAFSAHLSAAIGLDEACDDPVAIANAIEARSDLTLLFLDNGDAVTDSRSVGMIDHLIRYCPHNLRLIITCRARPIFDFVEPAARGMVHSIGGDDLRFILQEMQIDPSSNGSFAAESWPVIWRLSKTEDAGAVDRYLDVTFWRSLGIPDQQLLKKCAIAERLDTGLASALSGKAGAIERLKELTEQGLPILCDHRSRTHLRLEPAFRAFLLRLLAVEDGQLLVELNRRARSYYTESEQIELAVEHAFATEDMIDFATEDMIDATNLIADIWPDMIRKGDSARLLDWIAIVDDHSGPKAELALARCWALTLTSQPSARHAIAQLRSCLSDNDPLVPELAMLMTVLRFHEEGAAALDETIFQSFADNSQFWGSQIARTWLTAIRTACGKQDLASIRSIRQQALLDQDSYVAALTYALEGQIYWTQGHLTEAMRTLRSGYDEMVEKPDCSASNIAMIAVPLARILYESDAIDDATAIIERHWDAISTFCPQVQAAEGFRIAIRCAVASGHCDKAVNLIDLADLLADQKNWIALRALAVVERARLNLPPVTSPDTIIAVDEESRLLAAPNSMWALAWSILAEARAYDAIRTEDRPRLNAVAAQLLALGQALQDQHMIARATLFNVLPQLSGRCDRMVDIETVRLLNNAARIGFRRTITDVLELSGVHAEQNFSAEAYSSSSFIGLLKKVDPSRRILLSAGSYDCPQGSGFSFLTTREIEIVQALRTGNSNKEIARSLSLTPETVKWHLKNIMHKLRATSRDEVVVNAQTLGLSIHALA